MRVIAAPHKPVWPFVLNTECDQAQGLQLWTPGGPSGGPTLHDRSRKNRHGTLTNFGLTSVSGWTGGMDGGSCLRYDGSNDLVNFGTCNDALLRENSAMTVSCWMYAFSLGGSSLGTIFERAATGSVILTLRTSNQLGFTVTGGVALVRRSNTSVFNLSQWTLVTLTWDGVITTAASVKMYINGIEVGYATTTNGSTATDNSGGSIIVGARSGADRAFDGKIDDFRIYDRVLNDREIFNLFDPETRWELRYQPGRVKYYLAQVPGGSTPATGGGGIAATKALIASSLRAGSATVSDTNSLLASSLRAASGSVAGTKAVIASSLRAASGNVIETRAVLASSIKAVAAAINDSISLLSSSLRAGTGSVLPNISKVASSLANVTENLTAAQSTSVLSNLLSVLSLINGLGSTGSAQVKFLQVFLTILASELASSLKSDMASSGASATVYVGLNPVGKTGRIGCSVLVSIVGGPLNPTAFYRMKTPETISFAMKNPESIRLPMTPWE